MDATELYKTLLHRFPEAFIVTTNVDAQFELAGFPTERIFATQGDYRWFQPALGSPKTLVDNREWVFSVLPLIHDCRIPTEMIPSMPDGSPASLNLRVDDTFVEDFHWHQQARRYTDFVQRASQDNLLLLEFGIGYNTPGIIRLPFEQMAQRFPLPPSSDSTATTPYPTSKICPVLPSSPKTSPPSLTSCELADNQNQTC